MAGIINWTCVNCQEVLGRVLGGELTLDVPSGSARTRGSNVTLTCPHCGAEKTWYSNDPVVRAIYQLVDAVSGASAKRMIDTIHLQTLAMQKEAERKIGE